MLSWGISKYIEIKLQITYFYFIYSSFKNKKKSGSSPASLTVWFLKKNISLVIFYYLTKCEYLVAITSWDIEQYVYCNCLLTRLWRHKLWINLICLIEPFFYMTKKSKQKLKYLQNEKGYYGLHVVKKTF